MFVKVHKPVNTPCVCDNKDRCRALVEYLLKESLEDKPYYDTFFSHEEDYVPPVTACKRFTPLASVTYKAHSNGWPAAGSK